MNNAQLQLQAARDAGAADYAPVDLDFAQTKFQQAQAAIANRKYDVAAQLAQEAGADAELARAKARLGNARTQIQRKTADNRALQDQIEQALADQKAQDQQDAAGSAAQPLPKDMPAPSSSALAAPIPDGQGFQTMSPPTTDQGSH